MPQEVLLVKSLTAEVHIPSQPRGTGGAKWPKYEEMPALTGIARTSVPVTLPVGGTLLISFRRDDVTPQADVNLKISRDAKGVHVTNTPTNARNLSASIQQSGAAGNERVTITFKGA